MSSNPYGEPLEIEIRPSRIIATLLLAIHVTAAVICVQLPLAPFSRLVIFLAIIASLIWNVVMFWRRTPRRLRWSLEDGWNITNYNNVSRSVELVPEAHLGNWLVIAHFKAETGKRLVVMLARDSCSANGLRRMRIMLKYGSPKH